jgi:hypothetical protein
MHWRDPNDRGRSTAPAGVQEETRRSFALRRFVAVALAVVAAIFLYRTGSTGTSNWLPAVLWLLAALIWWCDKEYGRRYASLFVAIVFTKGAFI